MSVRRTLIAVAVLGGFIASVVIGQGSQAITTTRFSAVPFVSRPFASHRTPITTTWYCAGVPAADSTVGGNLVMVDPTDVPLQARITLFGTEGIAPVVQSVTVPARDKLTFDVDTALTSTFVSAMVEIDGGEGMVEQIAHTPGGDTVASCTTQTSSSWYFADGWTVDGSVEQLILTNPSDDTVIVDINFQTKGGPRLPPAFQGYSISPRTVSVINVSESGLVDEPIIGVTVAASRGRLIVARAQQYAGTARLGYSVTLGAPAPSEQVFFADGEKGAGITEQYVLYNPTDTDATVDATVLGPVAAAPGLVDPDPISVPSGDVVTFDAATITGLPDGPHSMVFATLAAPAIVVERVLTRPAGTKISTTVVLGMTSEYVVSQWYVPVGVDSSTTGALVVYNVDAADGTVTVKAIGPGGAVAVPGLAGVKLTGSGSVSINLTDPSVFGRPLVVESTQRIYVERLLPQGGTLAGRSGSWALPECGPCNFSSPPSS